jgi:hypothetical protein
VEYARIVEQSTVLDFEDDFDSDDLEACREHAALLRDELGPNTLVLIWDSADGTEVLIEG